LEEEEEKGKEEIQKMINLTFGKLGAFLLILVMLLTACGNSTTTPTTASTPTTMAATTTSTSTTTVAATAIASTTGVAISATTESAAASTPISGSTGTSVITITIAPPPTFSAYNNPDLDFFYAYANAKPLSMTEAAKNAFTISAVRAIQTESVKVEVYVTSDDPAKIFSSFADAAKAKGFRVARQDSQVVAVINDKTRDVGQATLIPVSNAPSLFGLTPDQVNGNIYAVITGRLAANRIIPTPVASASTGANTTTANSATPVATTP
jgi:hypothetical protein